MSFSLETSDNENIINHFRQSQRGERFTFRMMNNGTRMMRTWTKQNGRERKERKEESGGQWWNYALSLFSNSHPPLRDNQICLNNV